MSDILSDILCITNRKLCREPFFARLERIAAARPAGIILREKDLPEGQYRELAKETLALCEKYGTPCILHTFADVARRLNCPNLHLPLPALRALSDGEKKFFRRLGASCHSEAEAEEAQALGCHYILAGHIFDTDCKMGLPGRGLDFLENICRSVSIPVYAIGGIRPENLAQVREAGAAGACVMSGIMRCSDAREYLNQMEGGVR